VLSKIVLVESASRWCSKGGGRVFLGPGVRAGPRVFCWPLLPVDAFLYAVFLPVLSEIVLVRGPSGGYTVGWNEWFLVSGWSRGRLGCQLAGRDLFVVGVFSVLDKIVLVDLADCGGPTMALVSS
jgi:hypothetical protein